jgi:hypothetical protein
MKPVDRSIAPRKAELLLKQIDDPQERTFARVIIENTRYISFQEMKNKLMHVVNQLNLRQFNVLFDTTSKIGSEHWLTLLVWDVIRDRCVKVINDFEDIDNDLPIILIDDCIYSGNHTSDLLDGLVYNSARELNKELKNQFVIIVPYSSIHGPKDIRANAEGFGGNIGAILVGEYIKSFMSIEPITTCMKKDPDGCFEYMNETFGVEGLALPLYFDHKIANEFGSFPQFYTHILKKLPSREKIELIMKTIEAQVS